MLGSFAEFTSYLIASEAIEGLQSWCVPRGLSLGQEVPNYLQWRVESCNYTEPQALLEVLSRNWRDILPGVAGVISCLELFATKRVKRKGKRRLSVGAVPLDFGR